MKKKIFSIALASFVMAGCSSIVSKSDYAVAIDSNPEHANFVIKNRSGLKVQSGITPSTVMLKSSSGYFKGEAYTIEITKSGYSPKIYTLNSSVDGWYFGNILFGGLIGMLIVDPATGAMYNLPERADVSLDPQNTSSESIETLTIKTIDDLSGEEIAKLQRIN